MNQATQQPAAPRSSVHKDDYMLKAPFRLGESYSDGSIPYQQRDDEKWHCGFCGSIHPRDLVTLLKAGARLEMADQKYGWPHKFYLHGASWAKFYSIHLQDAEPADRDIIERAMGLNFVFNGDRVGWRPYSPLSTPSQEQPK